MYKVGDRVIGLNTWEHKNDGHLGTIEEITPSSYYIKWDKSKEYPSGISFKEREGSFRLQDNLRMIILQEIKRLI